MPGRADRAVLQPAAIPSENARHQSDADGRGLSVEESDARWPQNCPVHHFHDHNDGVAY